MGTTEELMLARKIHHPCSSRQQNNHHAYLYFFSIAIFSIVSTGCGGVFLVDELGTVCSDAVPCRGGLICVDNICQPTVGGGDRNGIDGSGNNGDGSGNNGDGSGNNGDSSGNNGDSSGNNGDGDAGGGDTVVIGGDGARCNDLDLDGYCTCCSNGPDCAEGNASLSAFDVCGTCAAGNSCTTDTPWVGGGERGNLPGPGNDPCSGCARNDGTIITEPGPYPGNCGTFTTSSTCNAQTLCEWRLPAAECLNVNEGDGFGGVTLAEGTLFTDFAWGANERASTVSRVDTVLAQEVGRYISVRSDPDDWRRPYVQPWGDNQSRCGGPSRTTIDRFGNAYVANRGNGIYSGDCPGSIRGTDPVYHGSVSKIGFYDDTLCNFRKNAPVMRNGKLTFVGCQCVDRNQNGRIETSRDYDEPRNGIAFSSSLTYDRTDSTQWPVASPCVGACTVSCASTACADNPSTPYPDLYCHSNGTPTNPADDLCSEEPELPEFLGNYDECVVWTRRIPGDDVVSGTDNLNLNNSDTTPRAMAIDKDGYIWVGDRLRSRFFKLDADGNFVVPNGRISSADPDDIRYTLCAERAYRLSDKTIVASGTEETVCGAQQCVWSLPDNCKLSTNVRPYGAVIDSGKQHARGFGYLWVTERNGGLQRIDTETGERSIAYDNGGEAYGITIDHLDRVWMPEALGSRRSPRLYLFDPTLPAFCTRGGDGLCSSAPVACAGCWTEVVIPASSSTTGTWNHNTDDEPAVLTDHWRGRGITTELLSDGTSQVWATYNYDWGGERDTGNNAGNTIISYHLAKDGTYTAFPQFSVQLPVDCNNPIGIGIGFDSSLWVVNRSADSMCKIEQTLTGTGYGYATTVDIGRNPYTYSDFTGNLFRSFTSNRGYYRVLVEACPDPGQSKLVRWDSVQWDADTPGQSKLEARFRFGVTSADALDPGSAFLPGFVCTGSTCTPSAQIWNPPIAGDKFLEIEFSFIKGDDGTVPVLYNLEARRTCINDG